MQVYPNQLSSHLAKSSPTVCLVFGDEPQQKLEVISRFREYARQQGFEERQNLVVDSQFEWHQLTEACQNMSLFSPRQYIELELPTGKPGKEGSQALLSYSDAQSPDLLLLIHGAKIGKDVQNSKWFKTLDKGGIYVPCYQLEGQQLRRWLQTESNNAGLALDQDCLHLMMDYFEGNLLAAKQEMQKLKLLYPSGNLGKSELETTLVDQSRFNVFQMLDAMLANDARKTVRLLTRLEAEAIEPTIISWALVKEWLVLDELQQAQHSNSDVNAVFNKHRIWRNKQPLYLSTLSRLGQATLAHLGDKLKQFDSALKSSQITRPYIELCHLALLFMPMALHDLPLHYDSEE